MAVGHRVSGASACLRAVRSHTTLDAGGHASTSASRPPYSEREAEVGSPTKTVLMTSSKSVILLNGFAQLGALVGADSLSD
jgi:hypothetical protein